MRRNGDLICINYVPAASLVAPRLFEIVFTRVLVSARRLTLLAAFRGREWDFKDPIIQGDT